jgi:hypothetical protein
MEQIAETGEKHLAVLLRIDSVCLRFEEEWKAGRTPSLQDALGEARGDERSALLAELLKLEADYRRRRGETPLPDAYLPRFPEDAGAVLAAFSASEDTVPHAPAASGQPPVPHHDILGELGRGGMGVVYRARQHWPPRVVAVKVVRTEGPDARRRFLDEIGLLAGVEHDNIVRVYEAGEADGSPYFSMELVAGGDLGRHLALALPPAEAAAALVERLARAVAYAHDRGIVHLDLKPSNVLMAFTDADGPAPWHERRFSPRIADFGLARGVAALPERGKVLGTPAYMAPEQAGAGETGPATDVWGLGAILYQCLTGKAPFPAGPAKGGQPPRPGELRPGVPAGLEAVCLRCLRNAPGERPASALALADELHRFAHPKPPRRWARAAVSWPMLVLYAGLLALAASWMWADRRTPFERARDEAKSSLKAGLPFALQGHEAMPGPFRPVLSDTHLPASVAEDGHLRIETTRHALVELGVPPPGCDEYEFSADVRHDSAGDEFSEAGVYFGHREAVSVNGGRVGAFYTLSFSDLGRPRDRPTRVKVGSHVYYDEAGRFPMVGGGGPVEGAVLEYPWPPFRMAGMPWRRLTVRVGPGGVSPSWGPSANKTEPIKPVPALALKRLLEDTLAWRKAMMPTETRFATLQTGFPPSAGVGLYANNARVSFRLISITPVKPE